MKIVAIIQARMESTRLPGKVLKDISGKPMLWHLIKRVQQARHVDEVAIAATTNKADDRLEKFATDNNIGIYRGSEEDIVDRYLNAGRKFDANIVVRIWGDCPLIDPELIDKLIEKYIDDNYEYANNFNPPTYPTGMNFEIYSLESLERIWKETNDTFYRQYPFEYIYAHHDSFKALYDKNDIDLSYINLTVDYTDDFKLITEIYRKLHGDKKTFHLGEILKLLETDPALTEMNQGLSRNIEYNRDKKNREDKADASTFHHR